MSSLFARSERAQYKFVRQPERKHSECTGLNSPAEHAGAMSNVLLDVMCWQAKENIYSTSLSPLHTKINLHYT